MSNGVAAEKKTVDFNMNFSGQQTFENVWWLMMYPEILFIQVIYEHIMHVFLEY